MAHISYRIIRSSRRTAAIQITPRGEVLVRCPRRTTDAEVDRFVRDHGDWIRSHLARVLPEPVLPPFPQAELAELTAQARKDLPERVRFWAERIGVSYGRITVRHQRTLWGSCSSAGNLNFNCLLMLAPEPVRDYVVVHELCHRRQMNHSPAFWAEVGRVMPDYDDRRGWLRSHGGELIGRLPKAAE